MRHCDYSGRVGENSHRWRTIDAEIEGLLFVLASAEEATTACGITGDSAAHDHTESGSILHQFDATASLKEKLLEIGQEALNF